MIRSPAIWLSAFLLSLVFWLYAAVGDFDFVNYDDNRYFYENPHVTGGLSAENVRWAFEIHGPSMWIPLTWLSHQAAVSFLGTEASPHHWVNLLLHAANVVLLFAVIRSYTGFLWRAALVASLFAVHPVHVESVAWITERKDVLSMCFVLLTLLAYRRFTEKATVPRFMAVVFLHACAVMAKPLAVTVPCLLLLLDFWPLARMGHGSGLAMRQIPRLVAEKIPLLFVSAFASWMTVLCQLSIQAIGSLEAFPLSTRLGNALIHYQSYLVKLVWPSGLAPFYPYVYERPVSAFLVAGLLLLVITVLAIRLARSKTPALLIGWFWFLGTLVPMIGLVQAGSHSMADRYAYLPFIGLYVGVVWVYCEYGKSWNIPVVIRVGLPVSILGAFATVSAKHLPVWRNSETLFAHAIRATEGNYLAHNNLGLALRERGENDQARIHFERSLAINPNYVEARNNLGIMYAEAGELDQALKNFEWALRIQPKHATSAHNLAKVHFEQGNLNAAETLFREALEVYPGFSEAAYDYGCLLISKGAWNDAEAQFRKTLSIAPSRTDAWINLGLALSQQGKITGAREAYGQALSVEPGNALVLRNLEALALQQTMAPRQTLVHRAEAMRRNGDYDGAAATYFEAIEKDPENPDLYNDLGVTFGLQKDHGLAIVQFEKALELDPRHNLARRNRAAAEAALAQSASGGKDAP